MRQVHPEFTPEMRSYFTNSLCFPACGGDPVIRLLGIRDQTEARQLIRVSREILSGEPVKESWEEMARLFLWVAGSLIYWIDLDAVSCDYLPEGVHRQRAADLEDIAWRSQYEQVLRFLYEALFLNEMGRPVGNTCEQMVWVVFGSPPTGVVVRKRPNSSQID